MPLTACQQVHGLAADTI